MRKIPLQIGSIAAVEVVPGPLRTKNYSAAPTVVVAGYSQTGNFPVSLCLQTRKSLAAVVADSAWYSQIEMSLVAAVVVG